MTTHTFKAGQQAFAAANVNVRRAPGYKNKAGGDLLGNIPKGTAATVLAGPEAADDLIWWKVHSTVVGGKQVEGWVAEVAPGGTVLLRTTKPQPARRAGPSTFQLGEAVSNVAQHPIKLRRSPGYSNKQADDILAELPAGASLTILQGPRQADRIQWWKLGGQLQGGESAEGWAAVSGARGLRFLAPSEFAAGIIVGMPFPDPYRVTQWWGENPDFYRQFKYDGVRLRGHNGIDFGMPVGVPMLAVAEGTVRRTGFEPGGFGNFVLLNHRWGESLYAHLSQIQVKRGQQVAAGETIALSGNSGGSTGPHLHFGLRIHPYRRPDGWGGFCDPEPFLVPETFELPDFAAAEYDFEPTPMGEEDPDNPRP